MIEKIVIVGGGSAGWLTASILASRVRCEEGYADGGPQIFLVESPDVATVGVGEGTWPTMRATLREIGVSETDFIRECDVSLKQGTRFNNWERGEGEHYYHPFSLPNAFYQLNLAEHWSAEASGKSFANAVSPQAALCDRGLSAKQISTPEFAFTVNYGYHLDAGKFSQFLNNHCVEKLGVNHLQDHVDAVLQSSDGSIRALKLRESGELAADLFVDCSGFAALLVGQHYNVEEQPLTDVLFNDRALAVQVPYSTDQEIQSTTHSSAQSAGWIWDIGLSTRRGVGHVYSSRYQSDEMAEKQLKNYIKGSLANAEKSQIDQIMEGLEPRKLTFEPKYRRRPWVKNCVAIGLSAGFVEPLEASALVLVETAAKALAKDIPQSPEHADVLAARFNQKMQRHWCQIVDFLKLHYLLSRRSDSDYWRAHQDPISVPQSLRDSLLMWRYRAPWVEDTPMIDELFSAASFQYVLYGMGFEHEPRKQTNISAAKRQQAQRCFIENKNKTDKLIAALPDNRSLHQRVMQYGFQRV